jgi:hypothetical protein
MRFFLNGELGFWNARSPPPLPPQKIKITRLVYHSDWNRIKNLCFISGLEHYLAKRSNGCSPLFLQRVFWAKIRHSLRNVKKEHSLISSLFLKEKLPKKEKKKGSKIAPTGHNMKGCFKILFTFIFWVLLKLAKWFFGWATSQNWKGKTLLPLDEKIPIEKALPRTVTDDRRWR